MSCVTDLSAIRQTAVATFVGGLIASVINRNIRKHLHVMRRTVHPSRRRTREGCDRIILYMNCGALIFLHRSITFSRCGGVGVVFLVVVGADYFGRDLWAALRLATEAAVRNDKHTTHSQTSFPHNKLAPIFLVHFGRRTHKHTTDRCAPTSRNDNHKRLKSI